MNLLSGSILNWVTFGPHWDAMVYAIVFNVDYYRASVEVPEFHAYMNDPLYAEDEQERYDDIREEEEWLFMQDTEPKNSNEGSEWESGWTENQVKEDNSWISGRGVNNSVNNSIDKNIYMIFPSDDLPF